jgi:hypothetical protein
MLLCARDVEEARRNPRLLELVVKLAGQLTDETWLASE